MDTTHANSNGNGITAVVHEFQTPSSLQSHHLSTLAIHGDDHLNSSTDVAPALHVSTTFRYASNPSDLVPARDIKEHLPTDAHIYSRETAPSSTRFEIILTPLLGAPCLTYSSGLAAVHALYVHLNPKRISIGGGYHGCHGVLNIFQRLTGAKKISLDCSEEELQEGDVIHLETPVNPTGEAFEIKKYADKAHRRGAWLFVDATFGPPGLQDPFLWGADVVMHAGTKYLGGHSDMLCGVLATKHQSWMEGLRNDRTYLGSVMGSLEAWLGVRSLRTLEVRVQRQSESCGKLVGWLEAMRSKSEGLVGKMVERVHHASLQVNDMGWLKKQMPNGFGPVFSIMLKSESMARSLPSTLELFHHATSLGGVESLIEWRAMSDETVDTRLVRVSIGLEHWEDLKDDMLRGFKALEERGCGKT